MNVRTAAQLTRPTLRLVPVLPVVLAGAIGAAWLLLLPDGAHAFRLVQALRGAALLVALGAAFSLDDPAATITAPSPLPQHLRAMVRVAVQVAPAAATWAGVCLIAVALAPAALPIAGLTLEQLALVVVAWAVAAWWRRHTGDTRGGHVAAPLVVFLTTAAAELPARLALFSSGRTDPVWRGAQARWVAVLSVAILALAAAVRDPVFRWTHSEGTP